MKKPLNDAATTRIKGSLADVASDDHWRLPHYLLSGEVSSLFGKMVNLTVVLRGNSRS